MITQYPLGIVQVELNSNLEDDTSVKLLVDARSGGLVVVPQTHYQVHTGASFRYSDSVTLNAAATQDYLITTPNTAKYAHFTFKADGSAITSFVMYEGADRTGTTSQTLWNANRNSGTTATVTIHKGASGGTTDGTQMITYSSGASQGASRSDAHAQYDNEWVLKANTKYLFRVTSGSASNLCNVDFQWYERTSLY